MHIILGATGHVGSAVAQALLAQGEPVMVVSHDPQKTDAWRQKGAQVAVADVHDQAALRHVFSQGRRLFLLNPPADPATATVAEERRSLAAILAALDGSGLEKVVAESTYGAQPADEAGDLGVLYEMEQALAAQPIPATIIRAAYYFSNWDAALPTARQESKIQSFYPADFKLPMVAPQDIGRLAARLLTEPVASTGLHYIEGPELYSPADVAAAFAAALHKPVAVAETPRSQWLPALQATGFSDKAAASFANMTALTLEGRGSWPPAPERGATSLRDYVAELVRRH